MLDNETKRKIDSARSILVGKVPDPKAQVEQITTALIYKFMDDMDREAQELGGHAKFITGELEAYTWAKLMSKELSGSERLNLYMSALLDFAKSADIPPIFRTIFKDAFLPYRDPETLSLFLKEIDYFDYDHSENLGNAFEYLLNILGSQGDAGQFRTPRHIIDFIVEVLEPKKNETVLDPACGTAGFLISAYKHIMAHNTLTPDEKKALMHNFTGYDISPDMVRLSLVNMYLHSFPTPKIYEYDTLTSEERWNEGFDVILANPPFMTPKGGIRPHNRFSVQANRSEVLFVDYIAEHLNLNGRAGIIVPEGIIFQSANAYKALRKMLIENNLLWAVVSLPAGIFNPYAGVKTSILLLDRTIAKYKEQILFVKVSNDGFDLGAQRREINKNDLPTALEVLKKYKLGEAIDHPVAQAVLKTKIAKSSDYNLTGDRYKENTKVLQTAYPMVKLGDYISTITPPYKIQKEHYGQIGKYPIIDQSQEYISGRTDNENFLIHPIKPLVIFGDHTCAIKYIEEPFAQGADGIKILFTNEELEPKFLYYYLKNNPLVSDGYKRHFSKLKEVEIPLPPLEIQNEIVAQIEEWQKIIDGAKQVINTYRPTIPINPSWNSYSISEIAQLEYGIGESAQSNGEYRYVRITDINQNGELRESDKKYIAETEESKRYELKKGDVLIARTGATFGKTLYFNSEEKSAFAGFLMRFIFDSEKINSKYFWCFAQSDNYWKQAKSLVSGGGQPQFNANAVNKIIVPLPPLEIQNQIVEQIEKERQAVESCKTLVEIFEAKIKDKINEVWSNQNE